jgi:lysophospholipase L1-like esterase
VIIDQHCRLGVLAFGDSITNGGGELQWGVALQSWALWVARGLGLPYTGYATDGARAADVVGAQLVAHQRMTAHRDARYELGGLYIGVNDVRGFDWDPASYERDLTTALDYLAQRCDLVLAVTLPLDLGRPRAGAKVREANTIIGRAAAHSGALILDLSDFGARNQVMADRVHPTAFGQIAIAERALDVLAATGRSAAGLPAAGLSAAGVPAVVRPSSLICYRTTRIGRLRGDFVYARRSARIELEARWRTWRGARRAVGR